MAQGRLLLHHDGESWLLSLEHLCCKHAACLVVCWPDVAHARSHAPQRALAGLERDSDFTFPCWTLPPAHAELRAHMEAHPSTTYIVKPTGRGEGRGIFLAHSLADIDSTNLPRAQFVVQPFLADPFLIGGTKFDLRCYVLVTSIAPLRAYLYDEGEGGIALAASAEGRRLGRPLRARTESLVTPRCHCLAGLVRFAAKKYRNGTNDRAVFLTNTSVGKKLVSIDKLVWTFRQLREWFKRNAVDSHTVFLRLAEVREGCAGEIAGADMTLPCAPANCARCRPL